MKTNDPKSLVQNEQNGAPEGAAGDEMKQNDAPAEQEGKTKEPDVSGETSPTAGSSLPETEDTEMKFPGEPAEGIAPAEPSATPEEEPGDKPEEPADEQPEEQPQVVEEEKEEAEEKKPAEKAAGEKEQEKEYEKEEKQGESEEGAGEEEKKEEEKKEEEKKEEEKKEEEKKEKKEDYEGITVEPVDYSHHTKDELIDVLKILLETKPVQEILDDVESIKVNFYKKHRAEVERLRKKFIEDGNPEEDFAPAPDPREEELKNLYKRFRSLRAEMNKQMEVQKQENLKKKYEVIGEIEALINSEESINKTFQDFRELQARWREIGPVPQQHVKNMWENYHYQVERFYDYIKINKELRDLDLKKNLEAKLGLCEQAETLLDEPNVVKAFRELQALHDQWREIGPVPGENREEIWERFKAATTQINKRHQDHFVKLKEEQKKNLEAKEELCKQVEAILEKEYKTPREWENASHTVIGIQKTWKTIGFAPKKHNAKIYKRFREACDKFFKAKRAFYSAYKEEQKKNLHLKTELCEQAEALQDSTDWKNTTEVLIELQKKWKEIGPVPRKQADAVWKRFREACDRFFRNKSKHFAGKEQDFARNLEEKLKLLEEIESYEPGDDVRAGMEQAKEFQERWNSIGFVPASKKDDVQNRFRRAINKLFDRLQVDDSKKNILKYRNRLENIKDSGRGDYKMQQDRDKFINRIKQLENDIVLWENNIGFFARSENADVMIRDVQNKIENARDEIRILEEKVRLIDRYDNDEL